MSALGKITAGAVVGSAIGLGGVSAHAEFGSYDASARGEAYLQVQSLRSERDAIARAQVYADVFPDTRVFLTDRGAYAIVVALEPFHAARELRQEAISFGVIPSDSFLRPGTRFRALTWSARLEPHFDDHDVFGREVSDRDVSGYGVGAGRDDDVVFGAEAADHGDPFAFGDLEPDPFETEAGFGFAAEGAMDGFAIQIASRSDARAALRLARRYRARFPNVRVFRTERGHFALVAETHRSEQVARSALRELALYGDVPDDSFVRPGFDYVEELPVRR